MVIVALLLRLPLLGRSVWFDEACMSDQRIGTFAQLLATLYVDIHPPLFVTFMHCWNRVFGDGELALRMPALLSGLACIPLTWWTGHRLVGDRAALWAAALLVLSPVHIWYCVEARLYAPMIACTLLAFGTFDRLLDRDGPQPRWLWPLHLANVAVMLALHYYLAVVVVALAVLAPIVARRLSRPTVRILLWHGVGILLLGGFVLVKQALGEFETSQSYMRSLDANELMRFLFGWCWTGNTLAAGDGALFAIGSAAQSWLGVGLIVIGCASIVAELHRRPRGWLVPIGVLVLPCFLLASAAVGYGNTYIERSLIASLPFLLLLAGAGIEGLPGRFRVAAGGVTVLFAIAGLLALYTFHETRWTVYKPNGDWRAATAWLGAEIDAGGAGRPVFTSTPNPRPLSYYDARIQDQKNLLPPMSAEAIRTKVTKRLGAWLGSFAERTFSDFQRHNQQLLADAKLIVRHSEPTPAELPFVEPRPDEVCYLVRDEWHPHVHVDSTIESLLADPGVQVLEARNFSGIAVYKVRIAR